MRDLLNQPLWQEEDLGQPIPDSPHAVSVALPTWASVVGYEEEDPAVLARLSTGYPRFVVHQTVREVFAEAVRRFGQPGETALVFASAAAAERCAAFLLVEAPTAALRLQSWPASETCAILLPEALRRRALLYWRYAGEVISSRQAEALLEGRAVPVDSHSQAIGQRLAHWTGQPADHVFLFPSGMAAIFAAFRALWHLAPGRRTAQLEFPYVDALCIPKFIGSGALFLRGMRAVEELRAAMSAEPLAGVFTEVPSNPLLRTANLAAVAELCQRQGTPLVVDDTVATIHNVDVFRVADLVTTSLTKNISGAGDVLAGALVVKRDSPFAGPVLDFLRRHGSSGLWPEDAAVLEENSRDFPQRMARINANAEALFAFLANHPVVEQVYFPKNQTPECYAQVRRPSGGFGGLISLDLKEATRRAPLVYDRLRVNKGPSLGTDFTLCCPYTLLAHYRELDWAEAQGVSRNLLRVAVGLEETGDLLGRFEEALAQ